MMPELFDEKINFAKPKCDEVVFDTKAKVQKIIKKPNYFKCYSYISESIKYDVDRILSGKCKFQKNETYTQFVKRMGRK